jgi:hypothetical protein
MDRDLFWRIAPYARLANNFVDSLHYKTPFYIQTIPELPAELPAEVRDPRESHSQIRNEYLSTLIRMIASDSS